MYDSHYEISDHHLRAYRGHLSLRLRTMEFTFEDLIGVQISQSLLDRILGTGSIEVGSKTAQIQLKIAGIYDPQYFANIISDRIDESRIADRTESKPFKSSRPSKAANTS